MKKLSISFSFSSNSFYFPCVCCYIPLFILILLIWIFSLCLLVSLGKGLSNLLIFSENQLFVSWILCVVLFISVLLIPPPRLILSCRPLFPGVFAFSALVLPGVLVNYRCGLHCLHEDTEHYALSSWHCLHCGHKLGNGVDSFSLNSRKSLISLFLP